MKARIVLSAMVFGVFTLTACSQETPQSEIPSVVLNAFNLEFANSTDVEWEKKGPIYEIEFEIENIDHEALIEETGNLIKYKKELQFAGLPEALKTFLSSNYSTNNIDDLHLLVIGENQYYQVELDGRITDAKKVFNEAGEQMNDVHYYN